MVGKVSPATEATSNFTHISPLGAGIAPRMTLGVGVAVAAIVLVAALSFMALRQQGLARENTLRTLNVLVSINAIASLLKDAETGQRGFLITSEPRYLEPYTAAAARLPVELETLKSHVQRNAEQKQRTLELEQLVTQKLAQLQKTIDVQGAGHRQDAVELLVMDRGKALMDQARALTARMIDEEQATYARNSAALIIARQNSFIVILGGLAVLLLWTVTAGWMSIRKARDNDVESWLRAGQAALGGALQGDLGLDAVGERVLRFMASQLGALAGALHVVDGEGALRRVAGFALAADAPRRFAAGEGLVGEAARVNRLLRADGAAAKHLRVESTVLSAPPASVLVLPVGYHKRVNAVLELALNATPDAARLAALERSADLIGTAVNSALDRARLEELLEHSQRQAESLQAQQEELRATNEELQQQGDELRNYQKHLEQQQTELEQANAQLEEQTRALEEHGERLAQSEAELRQRGEALQRANEYKSEFVANMSHELRTPLNSSLILANLLAENRGGNLTDEQVRFAQTIHSAGKDLLALINDILDLSKIEAGRMEPQRETVTVARLLDNLQDGFAEVARHKGLGFSMAVAPGTPDRFESDGQRVLQILRNLLSNAIKFTASGEVAVEVSAVSNAQGTRLGFAVRDTGIGVPADQQGAIFEAFRQADGSTQRRYGGTGLGLTISRDLARLLGGELTVDGRDGLGSTFTLWLPQWMPAKTAEERKTRTEAVASFTPALRVAEAANDASATEKPLLADARFDADPLEATDTRVLLIIEDDPAFAVILRSLAREHDFKTIVAHTAAAGLAAARQHRVNAILLDMYLPDATGISVLDELKRDAATRHIPVHAISVADYAREALSRGAMGYVLKPVERHQIVDALRRIDTRLTPSVRRVLLVEDDEDQRESIGHLLAGEGVEIISAANGAAALEQLRQQTFDCMVLDLQLPDVSGFELLEQMSELENAGFPPVIIYTARHLSDDEEQALRRYSRSIIIKDARSPERLLDEVTLFLHQVVSELPPEQQRMLRAARDRDAALEGRRILVVEDDVRNIFALSKVLEPHGARIDIARNGREALEYLERAAHGGTVPHLVLMDIMMPEMDGLTAMREIRRQEMWKRLPIIALTAKAMRDDQDACLRAGASDYLPKPLDVDRLLSLVRVWIAR